MFGFRDLVALATRAPSVHNTQPWHWCIAGERLSLFADSSRQLQYADPDGRDLVISCGAALQHLQVAVAAAGWKAHVRRMPNPYNDAQLANVSFRPEQPTPSPPWMRSSSDEPTVAVPRPGRFLMSDWTVCSHWARPPA